MVIHEKTAALPAVIFFAVLEKPEGVVLDTPPPLTDTPPLSGRGLITENLLLLLLLLLLYL